MMERCPVLIKLILAVTLRMLIGPGHITTGWEQFRMELFKMDPQFFFRLEILGGIKTNCKNDIISGRQTKSVWGRQPRWHLATDSGSGRGGAGGHLHWFGSMTRLKNHIFRVTSWKDTLSDTKSLQGSVIAAGSWRVRTAYTGLRLSIAAHISGAAAGLSISLTFLTGTVDLQPVSSWPNHDPEASGCVLFCI